MFQCSWSLFLVLAVPAFLGSGPASGKVAKGTAAALAGQFRTRISLDDLLSVRDGKGEWVSVFNGKDLPGFHTHLAKLGDKDPDHVFSVSDGKKKVSGTFLTPFLSLANLHGGSP